MSTILEDYASRKVRLVFLGQTITGLAETFITANRSSDLTSSRVGADGSVGTSKSPDRTGTIELTVDQSAPINIFLSGVVLAQDLDERIYRGAFTYADRSGAAIAKFSRVKIQSAPSLVGATERQDRTWTLHAEDFDFLSVPAGMAETAGTIAEVAAAVENLSSFAG
jgi:hypothetical protein